VLQTGDPAAQVLDDPHVLVTEHDPRVRRGPALVDVQVGAADAGGGDPHDHVVGMLDPRVRDLLDGDVEGFPVHERPHVPLPPVVAVVSRVQPLGPPPLDR
jgi:hypothetical protein